MFPCKITVLKKVCHQDLMEQYENPMESPCAMEIGQVFLSQHGKKPEGFCDSAWGTIEPFVMALGYGAVHIYDGWMKNKRQVILSCNDGVRPVSFLVEALCPGEDRKGKEGE